MTPCEFVVRVVLKLEDPDKLFKLASLGEVLRLVLLVIGCKPGIERLGAVLGSIMMPPSLGRAMGPSERPLVSHPKAY